MADASADKLGLITPTIPLEFDFKAVLHMKERPKPFQLVLFRLCGAELYVRGMLFQIPHNSQLQLVVYLSGYDAEAYVFGEVLRCNAKVEDAGCLHHRSCAQRNPPETTTRCSNRGHAADFARVQVRAEVLVPCVHLMEIDSDSETEKYTSDLLKRAQPLLGDPD